MEITMKIKIYQPSRRLTNADESLPDSIRISGSLGEVSGGTKFANEGVTFLVDTGCTSLLLGKPLLDRLGLNIETTGTVESELADGKTIEMEEGFIDLRLTASDGEIVVLSAVKCVITEDDAEPLIGMEILRLFDLTVHGGRLVQMLAGEDIDQLADSRKSEILTIARIAAKAVGNMTQPPLKPVNRPKPPKLQFRPRGFKPQVPPTPPKPPKLPTR
jgi:hypothetical protein